MGSPQPQQPEVRRQDRNPAVQEYREMQDDEHGAPEVKGNTGPVPEENRPLHHPAEEQDKPQGPAGT